MADFGSNYFMNYGFRERNNFGPVILDFPYIYETDPSRLVCKKPIFFPDGHSEMCGGLIDYDSGYNNLICTKCGARYRAIEIASYINNGIIVSKGDNKMSLKMAVIKDGQRIKMYDDTMPDASATIKEKKKARSGHVLKARRIEEPKLEPVLNQPEQPKKQEEVVGEQMTLNLNQQQNNFKPVRSDEPKSVKMNLHGKKAQKSETRNVYSSLSMSAKRVPDDKQKGKKNKNQKPQQQKQPEQPKVEENTKIAHATNEGTVNSYDAENGIVFISTRTGIISVPAKQIEDAMDAKVEALVQSSVNFRIMEEELEKAKADLIKVEDRNLELVEENDKLKQQNQTVESVNDTASQLRNKIKLLEELNADYQAKLQELEKELNDTKYEVNKNYEAEIEQLKADNAELQKDFEGQADYSDGLIARIRGLEETIKNQQETIQELRSGNELSIVSTEGAESPEIEQVDEPVVMSEEYESTPYSNIDDDGNVKFTELEGKYTTYRVVADHLKGGIPDGINPNDKIIVFDNGDAGYFSDQNGCVIAVTNINKKSLSDHEIRFKNLKG